jgi:SecD/SecF fusion protein
MLKGLVTFFAALLILICLYQLSFTWFVRSHENNMEERAGKWVKANFQNPEQKYPGNKELQALYADTLSTVKKTRLQRLLDSTKNDKIVLGIGTYQYRQTQKKLTVMLITSPYSLKNIKILILTVNWLPFLQLQVIKD